MAVRYLAILGPNSGDETPLVRAVKSRGDLTNVATSSHAIIFTSEPQECVQLNESGAVIGYLFQKHQTSERVTELPRETAARLLSSRGTELLTSYWGGYVAILDTPSGATVLRDPSGALPCLYLAVDGLTIVTSDIETLLASVPFNASVNWEVIGQNLFTLDLRNENTAISGIKELFAGYLLHCNGPQSRPEQAWSPWHFVNPPGVTDGELAERLHATIVDAVNAWAGCFDRILLGVSGGLDSSIIAASLAALHDRVTCVTMATDEPEGDERHYARLLTRAVNLPLIEAFHKIDDVDITATSSPHLARPILYALSQSDRATKFAIDDKSKIDAFFSGIGGDNVFCFMRSASPLVDRIKVDGLGPGAWLTINDICELTEASFWEVLKAGLRKARQGNVYSWVGDATFLHRSVLQANSARRTDPWLDAPSNALPGKVAHVAKLTRIQATIESYERYKRGPKINPLLSQPVVELCLSIPTWKWVQYGRNRSVARQAFASDLPEELISRVSKGGPDSFAFEVIQRNRPVLREHLLNGQLAANDVIDVKALSKVFSDPRPISADHYLRFLILAEAEAWTRYWSSRQMTAPASI